MVLKNLSSFKWEYDDIIRLQEGFEEIVKKHHLIFDFTPIISNPIESVESSLEHQICLQNQDLKELVVKVDELINSQMD